MADESILLSEWAGDTRVPRLLGGVEARPCIICGDPLGICTHDPITERRRIMAATGSTPKAKASESATTESQTSTTSAESPLVNVPGPVSGEEQFMDLDAERSKEFEGRDELRVAPISPDEAIASDKSIPKKVYKSLEGNDELVELTEDVVEEFYFPDTKRPSYRLLFTKGQTVRRSIIDAMNQTAAASEGPDIDSTTIAYQRGKGDTNVDAAPAKGSNK